jgi:two-component system invasion response regulator UvrY
MLNILIACDHKASREALCRTLDAQPFFKVIAVCADTHAAIAITGREQPDIVFIDGSTDPLSAIEAAKKIKACSTAGVIALSRYADTGFAAHMLAAGALGYLTSQSSGIEVITAVKEVSKDNLYCCLETKHVPVQTPDYISPFKKSISSLRDNTKKKMNEVVELHWHAILKFTN